MLLVDCNSSAHRDGFPSRIASLVMTKKPTPSKESRAIKAAIDASGLTKAAIAERMGVAPALVSQWSSGLRPMSADKAPIFAKIVGAEDPRVFSNAYGEVELAQGSALSIRKAEASGDVREYGLTISRLENDLDSIKIVLGILVGIMRSHRPNEAEDVAEAIRRSVPPKFRDKGTIGELLSRLEKPIRK